EALSCFDRALDMRRGLPIDDDPVLRYGLAAGPLNRGYALFRLVDSGRMVDALAAFDEGIDVLRALPLTTDARFPRRLAMACHNRGLALQAMGRPVAEPIAAFTDALAILDDDQASGITDRQYLLAVVLTNLASARLFDNTAESAALARPAAARGGGRGGGGRGGRARWSRVRRRVMPPRRRSGSRPVTCFVTRLRYACQRRRRATIRCLRMPTRRRILPPRGSFWS